VAGGFLDRLLGRTAPPPPELADALADLDRAATERPTLAGPITLLRALLPLLFQSPLPSAALTISREQAQARLAGGMPLLRGELLPLDAAELARRWQQVCSVIGQQGNTAADALAKAVRQKQFLPADALHEVLAGRAEAVHVHADALGLDAALTATVLRLTVFPLLSGIQATLTPLRQGCAWERGYCPICGSWPLLGEFRGLEQTRWLRCGWCAADWDVPRLFCPYCGTRDHEQLGHFQVEGEEERWRAMACSNCKGYVKMTATLTPLTGPRLLVADAASLHLDLAAAERGLING
jgi:FdhE protein